MAILGPFWGVFWRSEPDFDIRFYRIVLQIILFSLSLVGFFMERVTSHPITTILDGPNYVIWAQAMSSYLKSQKLWRVVTGDITAPKPIKDEDPDKYLARLEDGRARITKSLLGFATPL